MLTKFIKKIRAKPERVRKGITLGVSVGVTSVIAFFWFISFLNYSAQVFAAKPKGETPTSFLNKVGSMIGEGYANARESIDGASASLEEGMNATSTDATDSSDAVFQNDGTAETDLKVDNNEAVGDSDGGSNSTFAATSTSDTKTLNDILNTKKQDNQDNKATTSSEVLVQ